MFGKSIDKKAGLCILDYETVRLKDRVTSDVIYKSKYFETKVVGFVNKMTEMYHNIKSLRLYSQETVEVLYWIIMGMS